MCAAALEQMKKAVCSMLDGIQRYHPDNIATLEKYVEVQIRENAYDLEANLAVLKLYQLFPHKFNLETVKLILIKALTNFPHADFVLCKCLLNEGILKTDEIKEITYLGDLLERCDFVTFWTKIYSMNELMKINGFVDSIRKFVCHVVNITYQKIDRSYLAQLLGSVDDNILKQWVKKSDWRLQDRLVFVACHDESIKTKNINEKIELENAEVVFSLCN